MALKNTIGMSENRIKKMSVVEVVMAQWCLWSSPEPGVDGE